MFEDRSYKRTFYSAPQSVTSMVAAFLEPAIIVAVYLAVADGYGEPIVRSDLVLCLLVFALTFPGRNRFKDSKLTAAVDILTSWVTLLAILALCGYATNSFMLFDREVLAVWALATPVVQWVAVMVGRELVKWHDRQPESRRPAIVIGAAALGVRVAQALRLNEGSEFAGYFDDRSDDRVHPDAAAQLRGGLNDVAGYIGAHRIKEVYITLPLGSQPRILALLESLQGTTASLFFVPDVFGISIIQGRLQDMNGVPVVGICETPFTGTNGLAKRVSDIVLASLILVLISPVLLAVAIGVKLSSPGPIIFKQKRNGLDGEEIVVYKFRSMRTQDNGPVVPQATKGDPRTTAFGRFIRRTSLDELPQFFNVLHRGETDTIEKMRSRVEYDLEYLRNWSIALDLQIIARTVKLMFFDPKAY